MQLNQLEFEDGTFANPYTFAFRLLVFERIPIFVTIVSAYQTDILIVLDHILVSVNLLPPQPQHTRPLVVSRQIIRCLAIGG